MSETKKTKDVSIGDKVDAYYNNSWWEGDVMKILNNKEISIFFKSNKEQKTFKRNQIRFHREWIDNAWNPPLDESESESDYEDEDDDVNVLPRIDTETVRELAKRLFTSGTVIEVSSDEKGYKGSWFAGKVVNRISEEKYIVEYRDIREDNGIEPLKEEADFLHIRPPPPIEEEEGVIDYVVRDKIDAFYNDAWWVGDVVESMKEGRVGVYFKQDGKKIRFGRSGLRLHKDWVNGKWEVPSKRIVHEEVRNVRPKKQEFDIGASIEVSSEEKGFEDSWFPAKLIEYRRNEKCLVEYDSLKAEDGKDALREEVKVLLIRPQPVERVMVCPFEKFDRVDAFYNDGWWVGEIVKVLAKSNYLVNFKKSQEVLKFHYSHLRIHQDWVDGKWI